MRTVAALLAASFRAILSNKRALIIRASLMAFQNALFLVFWIFLLSKTKTLGGWTLNDILQLQGLIQVFFGLSFSLAIGARDLPNIIKTGGLDVYLLRPYHPLIQISASKIETSPIGDLIMGIALLCVSSAFNTINILTVLFLGIVGSFIWACAICAIFSLSFWRGASPQVLEQIQNITITLSMYPETILGRFLRAFAIFVLPVGLMTYLPIRLLRDPSPELFLAVLGAAIFLAFLAKTIFDIGVRRYESGSGWSVQGG